MNESMGCFLGVQTQSRDVRQTGLRGLSSPSSQLLMGMSWINPAISHLQAPPASQPPSLPVSQSPSLPGCQSPSLGLLLSSPTPNLHHHLMTSRRCESPKAQLCGPLLKGWLSTLVPASPFGGSDTPPSFPTPPAGPTQGAEGFFWELNGEEESGEATEAQARVVCSAPVVQAGLQAAWVRYTGMMKGKDC